MVELLLLPLRGPSRAERVRKLFDREDTLRIVSRHLFRCHASQESKVIRLNGFGSAKLLELTHLAVSVQYEWRFVDAGVLES
jgi:hypothetical protein